ncbi:MAG: hypothetical protein ACLFRI_06520 [Candidatus Izemoplasmataceae bacterium]
MLNKRTSDIIFVALMVVTVAVVFFVRVTLLSQVDTRIENTERNNQQLTSQIIAIERIVEDNRNQEIPSMVELHQEIPFNHDLEKLQLYIFAQLELAGIPNNQTTDRNVVISTSPTTYPEDSPLRVLTEEVDLYTILITFKTNDVDQIQVFLERVFDSEQLFIIQSVEYDLREGEEISVSIALAAAYTKSDEVTEDTDDN